MAIDVSVDSDARDFVAAERTMLIGGDWVSSASGKTFETLDPSTGEVLARVAQGDSEDIDRAVKTARAAFETGPWATMTPSERGRILHRLGDNLAMVNGDTDSERFFALITLCIRASGGDVAAGIASAVREPMMTISDGKFFIMKPRKLTTVSSPAISTWLHSCNASCWSSARPSTRPLMMRENMSSRSVPRRSLTTPSR